MTTTPNIQSGSPLGFVGDTVYAPRSIEHTFEVRESERHDEWTRQAETEPHLTVGDGSGAATALTLEETLMRSISLLKADITATLAQAEASGLANRHVISPLAVMCAQAVLGTVGSDLSRMPVEDRTTVLNMFDGVGDLNSPWDFWATFRAALDVYFTMFHEREWTPLPGVAPEDSEFPLVVWRTPDDRVVCDYLTALDSLDCDAIIAGNAAGALDTALFEFGENLAGVRIIDPSATYAARWCHPDGSLERMVEDLSVEARALVNAMYSEDAS